MGGGEFVEELALEELRVSLPAMDVRPLVQSHDHLA